MKQQDSQKKGRNLQSFKVPKIRHLEPHYEPLSKLKIERGKIITENNPLDYVVPWQIKEKKPTKH